MNYKHKHTFLCQHQLIEAEFYLNCIISSHCFTVVNLYLVYVEQWSSGWNVSVPDERVPDAFTDALITRARLGCIQCINWSNNTEPHATVLSTGCHAVWRWLSAAYLHTRVTRCRVTWQRVTTPGRCHQITSDTRICVTHCSWYWSSSHRTPHMHHTMHTHFTAFPYHIIHTFSRIYNF